MPVRPCYPGKIDIVYQRLKEGSLLVTKKGDVYSMKGGRPKPLTIYYDTDSDESKRYCFVIIWKTRIHVRKGQRIVRDYRRKIAVHKLVWIAFHGPIPKNHRIHHDDHNNQNNCETNLRCWHKDKHDYHHRNGDVDGNQNPEF